MDCRSQSDMLEGYGNCKQQVMLKFMVNFNNNNNFYSKRVTSIAIKVFSLVALLKNTLNKNYN